MMRVVILGAGYAGLEVARRLGKVLGQSSSALITLVNAHDYHVFTTELHKVAAGTAGPGAVSVSLKDVLPKQGVELVVGKVQAIRPEQRAVLLDDGRELQYDRLVVALGGMTEHWGIPGLKEHSLSITGLRGSLAIRQRVKEAIENAKAQGRKAHVVIGGGGLTGVELAGELAYKMMRGHRITVVEMGPKLLLGQPDTMADDAERLLTRMGVAVRTGVGLKSVEQDELTLSNDEQVRYDVLLWAGGVRGNRIVGEAFPSDKRDRAIVDSYLRSEAYPDVYILGDSAAAKDASGKPVPPTAQAALGQAETVVEHILRSQVQEEGSSAPYSGKSKGVLVSIGPKHGLGKFGPFGGSGRMWKLLKDANDMRYHLRVGAQLTRGSQAHQEGDYATANQNSGDKNRAHSA